jgi:hypothetical protein
LEYSFDQPDNSYVNLRYLAEEPLDWSGFGGLRWWVYCPEALGGRVQLYLYDTEGRYACYRADRSFSGWRAFSFRLRTPSYYGKSGELDLSTITQMHIYVVNSAALGDGKERQIVLDGVELTPRADAEHASYAIWVGDPLTPAPTAGIPEHVTPNPAQVQIEALGNEWESRSLVLSNLTDEPLYLRVVLTDFGNVGSGEIVPNDFAQLRAVMPTGLRKGTSAYDALPRLGEAQSLVVPAQRNQELFLAVNTTDLAAGEYEGYLMTLPLAGGAGRKSINIRLTVHPLRLPECPSLKTLVFEIWRNYEYRRYVADAERVPHGELRERELEPQPRLLERYVQDLVEHGITVFRPVEGLTPYPVCDEEGKLVEVMDPSKLATFEALTRIYKRHCPPRQISVCTCGLPRKLGYPASPHWQENTKRWVEGFVGWLKTAGFAYEDFMLYLFDEVHGENAAAFAEFCAVVKEADPAVRIFLTLGGRSTLDDMKAAAPYVDIWDPSVGHLKQDDEMQFLRGTGKPIWFYNNYIPRKYADALSARLQPWIVRANDLQGCGFWAYDRFVGDAWDDDDMRGLEWPKYSDCMMVYPGTEGPIPTRRWEAFREGVEDYEYTRLLEKHAADAPGAQEFLQRIRGEVPESAAAVHKLRAQMLEMLKSVGSD